MYTDSLIRVRRVLFAPIGVPKFRSLNAKGKMLLLNRKRFSIQNSAHLGVPTRRVADENKRVGATKLTLSVAYFDPELLLFVTMRSS